MLLDKKSRQLKFVITASSVFFVAIGVVIFAIGLWFVLDRNFATNILGVYVYSTSMYILMAIGIIDIIIAGLSLWGTLMENRCCLLAVLICYCVIIIFSLVAGIMAIIFSSSMASTAESYMTFTLINYYGVEQLTTDAWNATQSYLRCCGVRTGSWDLYKQSRWIRVENQWVNISQPITYPEILPFYKYVPISCCLKFNDPQYFYHTMYGQYWDVTRCQTWKLGPPAQNLGGFNDALYYTGCYDAAMSYLGAHSVSIALVSFAFFVMVIIAFVVVLMMFIQVVRGQKGKLPTSQSAGLAMAAEPTGEEKNPEEFAMQQMAATQYGAPYGGQQYGGAPYDPQYGGPPGGAPYGAPYGAPQYDTQQYPPGSGFGGPGMYPEKR